MTVYTVSITDLPLFDMLGKYEDCYAYIYGYA